MTAVEDTTTSSMIPSGHPYYPQVIPTAKPDPHLPDHSGSLNKPMSLPAVGYGLVDRGLEVPDLILGVGGTVLPDAI